MGVCLVFFRDLVSCVAVWRQPGDHPLQPGWPRLQETTPLHLSWRQRDCVCEVMHHKKKRTLETQRFVSFIDVTEILAAISSNKNPQKNHFQTTPVHLLKGFMQNTQ